MYCKWLPAVLLFLGGCRTNAPVSQAVPRTAVLRFENFGAAENDWNGRAISELLKRRFSADRMPRVNAATPGISTERLAAIEAGATRIVTGYYTAIGGSLDVTAFSEDPVTQKISGPAHASGSLSAVTKSIASQFGASGNRSLNASSPALREFALAADSAGPAATAHYELSLQADPNFGPAYLGLVRHAIASNELGLLQRTFAAAAVHNSSFSQEDRAYLQLESATASRDNRARVQAIAAINALSSPDAGLLQGLADAEMSVRKPAAAAEHLRQAIALAPGDPNLRNLLVYAALFANDAAGARGAAAAYKQLHPQDPNAFDTEGDVEFAFGQFAAAEKIYLATPDRTFQNFLPSWKAARARLMTGDAAGASALFEQHRAALQNAHSPIAGYRAAEWLVLTGHRPEGAQAMAQVAASSVQPEIRSVAFAQAAIWAVLAHDNAHAIPWADSALHPAQIGSFVPAAIARFLAQEPASPLEWSRRAETNFNGANVTEVRRLALGLALLLSKRFGDAVPVWKELYGNSNVNEPGPAYLYAWALLESGHQAEAAALLRLNPIPAAGVTPSFEALYIPNIFEWRKASLRQ